MTNKIEQDVTYAPEGVSGQMRVNGDLIKALLELKADFGAYINGGAEKRKEIEGKYK